MWTIVGLLALAALVYIVVALAVRFAAAEGSVLDRAAAAVRGSATVAVIYAGTFLEAIPLVLQGFGDFLAAPGVSAQVQALFPSSYHALVGLGVTVATYLARLRTLE